MKRTLIVVMVVMACAIGAIAQQGTAVLSGVVRDTSGGVVVDAQVVATNAATGVATPAASDANGRYVIRALPPGTYNLSIHPPAGFQSQQVAGLVLQVGQELSYDLTLKVGSVATAVTVRGQTPLVELQKAQVDNVVTQQDLQNLPLNSRNFVDLTLLVPGSEPNQNSLGSELSVNGQSGFANNFVVDGLSDQFARGGAVLASFSQETLQEFQVVTQQGEAEYGQANGAMVNIVTRSGGNQYHGEGYGFFRTYRWDANNAENNAVGAPKPDTSREDIGGDFGGPIITDKAFFFGSYEYTDNHAFALITSPLEAGQQIADGSVVQLAFGRVDWDPSEFNRFALTYNLDNSNAPNQGPGGLDLLNTAYTETTDTSGFGLHWDHVFSPRFLGEFSAGYSQWRNLGDPLTPSGPEIIRPSSVSGKLSTLPFDLAEYSTELNAVFSYVPPRHEIKWGVDFMNVTSNGQNENLGSGVYTFTTDTPFDPSNPATYPYEYEQRYGPDTFHIPDGVWGLFVQDKWALTPDFTLTYGLRYDFEDAFTAVGPIGTVTSDVAAYPGDTPPKNDPNELAPRLGFTWSPFGSKTTVVRGGYGMFYGRVPLNEVSLVINNTVNTTLSGGGLLVAYNPPYPTPPTGVPSGSGSADVLANNLKLPYTSQTTLGVEHQLTNSLAFDATYVYARGYGLWVEAGVNAPNPVTDIRPNSHYQNISAQSGIGSSWYNALELSLRQRASWGSFLLAYTYSKDLDDVNGDPNSSELTDQFNILADKGPANNDIPNRLVGTGTFSMPWRFIYSTVLAAQSGFPYSALAGYDVNGDGYANDRAPGFGRNTFRCCSDVSWDNRVGRKFNFSDRYTLELFAEMYNSTNTANYTSPITRYLITGATKGTYVMNPQFGVPQAAQDPRRLQAGLQFWF